MSTSRNLEEKAAACYAKFEEKVDSLVNKEKASFKEFCQSETTVLKILASLILIAQVL